MWTGKFSDLNKNYISADHLISYCLVYTNTSLLFNDPFQVQLGGGSSSGFSPYGSPSSIHYINTLPKGMYPGTPASTRAHILETLRHMFSFLLLPVIRGRRRVF